MTALEIELDCRRPECSMTPESIKALGLRLYGPDYQSPMARAVGVTRMRVWAWVTGRAAPSPLARKQLAILEKTLAGTAKRPAGTKT